jgi:hypothetical protein
MPEAVTAISLVTASNVSTPVPEPSESELPQAKPHRSRLR